MEEEGGELVAHWSIELYMVPHHLSGKKMKNYDRTSEYSKILFFQLIMTQHEEDVSELYSTSKTLFCYYKCYHLTFVAFRKTYNGTWKGGERSDSWVITT